ncbi:hypothetical protein G6011_09833 [Alternaria panax]|uniref:Uncharacterized protein n=1 Tax=Alternaria panax TaxID=48097 RepID=A0AAD4FC83_9PLEO|nr:hypothetical protein G6011_09833 [Alternaria panax]
MRYVEQQKRRILVKVSEILENKDLLDLRTRFPSVYGWFEESLHLSVARQLDEFGWSEGMGADLASKAFSDALQHALNLAKKRRCPLLVDLVGSYSNDYFVEGALYDIFSWHPKSWKLPSDDELAKLEVLICIPAPTDEDQPTTNDGIPYFSDVAEHLGVANMRWYFSAASIAIDFLQKLPREQRQNMQTIILNEDFKAFSRPRCHVRGLISFCLESSNLRIERRIGLFTDLLPEGIGCIGRSAEYQWLMMAACFRVLIP